MPDEILSGIPPVIVAISIVANSGTLFPSCPQHGYQKNQSNKRCNDEKENTQQFCIIGLC